MLELIGQILAAVGLSSMFCNLLIAPFIRAIDEEKGEFFEIFTAVLSFFLIIITLGYLNEISCMKAFAMLILFLFVVAKNYVGG